MVGESSADSSLGGAVYDGADSGSGASGSDVVCASGGNADSSESGEAVSSAYGTADWS